MMMSIIGKNSTGVFICLIADREFIERDRCCGMLLHPPGIGFAKIVRDAIMHRVTIKKDSVIRFDCNANPMERAGKFFKVYSC